MNWCFIYDTFILFIMYEPLIHELINGLIAAQFAFSSLLFVVKTTNCWHSLIPVLLWCLQLSVFSH